MVASSAPVDQFVVRHPSYFFDASPEHALINPDNLNILVNHVKCAAFELPFTAGEQYGRVDVQEVLGVLQEAGLVHRSGGDPDDDSAGQWNWTSESYPADAVSLRSMSSDNFVVVDQTGEPKVIGETDFTSALTMLHPKAIYIIEGRLFQVEKLDFDGRKAYVRSVDCDYYTDAIDYTKVTILDCFASDARGGGAPRRGARRLARRRLQEDQVPHQRERRLRRARPARAADAHHVLLARGAGVRPGDAAVRRGRSARRDSRAGLRDEERGAAAADVRSARHRPVGERGRRGDAGRRSPARTRRASSSTTPIPAASASARRSTGCTTSCSPARAPSSTGATARTAVRPASARSARPDRWPRRSRYVCCSTS